MTTSPIVSIDLVRAALRTEGLKNVPVDRLRRFARDYEAFLLLTRRHGGPVAPTRAIDEMWHLHMLHPVAYFEDCMRLFGRILDHDGGFGAIAEEREALERTFERTKRLWEEMFDTPYADAFDDDAGTDDALTKCWHDCVSRCWHACSSKSKVDALGAAAE